MAGGKLKDSSGHGIMVKSTSVIPVQHVHLHGLSVRSHLRLWSELGDISEGTNMELGSKRKSIQVLVVSLISKLF